MSALRPAETDALAKMAFHAFGFTGAWEELSSAEHERWRAVVRAVVRAVGPPPDQRPTR